MDRAEEIFAELKDVLEQELFRAGYRRVEDAYHPQAFGSRCVTYESPDDSVRLVWDGKENWFVLEQSPLQRGHPVRAWADIAFQRFDPRSYDEGQADEVKRHVSESLREYLG